MEDLPHKRRKSPIIYTLKKKSNANVNPVHSSLRPPQVIRSFYDTANYNSNK
jgi:hypothetical protein